MRAVVVGVHIAHACLAGNDVVGFLGLGFVGNDALIGILNFEAAVAKHGTGGLFHIVGVGGVVVHEIDTRIQDHQGLVSFTALGHIIGVHVAALRGGQFLGGIALAANHKGTIAHQGDLPGSVLHVVHFVTGLVAAGFLSVQVLGVVVDIAAAVLALCQHADAGLHGQHIAFPGVGAGHVEILGGVGFFALQDPLIVAQLIAVFRGQHQQVDLFDGLSAIGLMGFAEERLLVESIGGRRFRFGSIGFRFQLGQDFIGTVGIVNGVDDAADGRNGNQCHKHEEG